jgi:hypothetical protein
MRKAAQPLLLVFSGLLILSATARAQLRFSATLPFAFQVEETKFPQGAYLVHQDNPDMKITIRSQRGRESGQFAGSPLVPQSALAKDETWLVFHRYGDKYFLSEIWSRHIGRLMTISAAEKQLRDKGATAREVRVNVKAN